MENREEIVRKIIEASTELEWMQEITEKLHLLENELHSEEWGEKNFEEDTSHLIEEFFEQSKRLNKKISAIRKMIKNG